MNLMQQWPMLQRPPRRVACTAAAHFSADVPSTHAHLRHPLLKVLESEAPLPLGGWLGRPIITGLAARHVACRRSCRTVTSALTWVLHRQA
jgi:hypothetical protein